MPYAFNSGGTGSGFYKSIDGGKTWKELTNGLPAKPFGRIAFALSPSSPQNMLAIVESAATGLYISSDGGESWKKQGATSNVEARPFYFSVIQVDPKDAKECIVPLMYFLIQQMADILLQMPMGTEAGYIVICMHFG